MGGGGGVGVEFTMALIGVMYLMVPVCHRLGAYDE